MKAIQHLVFCLVTVVFFQSCTQDDHSPKPTASFTAVQESEGKVTFNLTSSNTHSYLWNFGDGDTSTDKSPTHTYKRNGKYAVTVTASGNEGDASEKKEISVTNITGSAVFYTYDAMGNPSDVFVDGVKIGTTASAFRVIPPRCGLDGAPTAYKLTEGTHSYEIINVRTTARPVIRGTFTVIGGECTRQHYYFEF